MTLRRLAALTLVLGAAHAALLGPARPAAAAADRPDHPGRLLVISVPGLTWAEVEEHDLPNLERLLDGAALANLAPRSVSARATPGSAYLTISAGTRAATSGSTDGQVLGLDEESAGSDAGEIFTRRTGVTPDGPYVSLVWPSLVRANAARPYDAELGLLTETLEAAEVSASVIGNADGTESIGSTYERQVGLALADANGVVPAGELGKGLLAADPSQPFGLRLDLDAVESRFTSEWRDALPGRRHLGGVVMVEASDTARLLRYRSTVDLGRYQELYAEALARTDDLIGRLLDQVTEEDTVMLLAPYNRRGDRDLTVVALRGPRVERGYLRSASTQRAGFLTLVDVAPTVLDVLGIDRPTTMEGRPAIAVASDDPLAERVDHLVTRNLEARFRERLLNPTTTAVLVLLAGITAAAMFAHTSGWSARARATIAFLGLVDLGILPASYLARAFPIERLGEGFYWAFVVAVAVVAAVASTVAARVTRRPLVAVTGLLALVFGVIAADVMTGSNLSLSAAFGYSATGNSRLYGISNYAYAQVAAAVCLLAAILASRGRRGRIAAVGLMVATLAVLGVPVWGSDVGGVLAFTPAVLVFVFLLRGRRIRLRTVGLAVAATAAAIGVFGALDLARPPGERAHLGRLFERVGDEGVGPLVSIIERKLLANLSVSTSSLWVLAIPMGIGFAAYLLRAPDRPYGAMVRWLPALPAGLWSLLVAGVLGSALNDSGVIVGGIAAAVVTASLVVLLMSPGTVRGGSAPPG
ncbi:MAG: hypothetical protein GXY13_06760 [Acidimicrobiales bacterium]|nr:hypothetical protein [Acidimicrobiales bacterium]